jgi:hypothetical protein
MVNPHNSPWLKPASTFVKIDDNRYRWKFMAIKKHITTTITAAEYHSHLAINKDIYIAKNSNKFRLKSHLDWAYYTPKTLANAIDNNTVESYYEIMLNDVNSDPNVWKDNDFEMELKTFYAQRVGRASSI